MCKKTNTPPPATQKEASSSSFTRLLVNFLTILYTCGFLGFRVAEIAHLIDAYPLETLTSFVAFWVATKMTPLPWNLSLVLGMLALVYVMDDYVLASIPKPKPGTVVAITGANSGVGLETAKALAQYSSVIVIMACRSMAKCHAAADSIRDNALNVIPMQLDLSSFDSVRQFVDSVQQTIGKPVDVLFNNAGYVPPKHEPTNDYGLDPSFTSMHLSHHLLAELLVERNPRLRLVATSSGTHHFCTLPVHLPDFAQFFVSSHPGCIDEAYLAQNIYSAVNDDKYIVAKAANVLHVAEFPLRHPRAKAIAIDLGWVGTSIQPWMRGQITPTSLGWMRSARIGIHPMLQAILQPYKERDWAREGGVTINTLGKLSEPFPPPIWRNEVDAARMKQMAKKLWQTTTEILQKHGCTACQ